mgnify:CR=1 FL=1
MRGWLKRQKHPGWLAINLGRPVRWLEDRREALVAGANCREHFYDITLYAERDGRIAEVCVQAGSHVETGDLVVRWE